MKQTEAEFKSQALGFLEKGVLMQGPVFRFKVEECDLTKIEEFLIAGGAVHTARYSKNLGAYLSYMTIKKAPEGGQVSAAPYGMFAFRYSVPTIDSVPTLEKNLWLTFKVKRVPSGRLEIRSSLYFGPDLAKQPIPERDEFPSPKEYRKMYIDIGARQLSNIFAIIEELGYWCPNNSEKILELF